MESSLVCFIANILEDLRVGKSLVKFHDNSTYLGQFVNDDIEGNGILTDAQGNKFMSFTSDKDGKYIPSKRLYNGAFVKGKLYGQGEIKYKNGSVYNGQLKGSKRDGTGKMTYVRSENKDFEDDIGVYEGQWHRDQRCGEGTMNFTSGDIFKGEWKNGTLTLTL